MKKLLSYLKINKAIQILLMFLFLANAGASMFYPIMAIFITGNLKNASLATAGFALAIYSIVKSMVQIPMAKKIDRQKGEKDDFYVLMTGAVLGIIFIFGLTLISKVWHLYLLEIFSGIADGCLMAAYYGIFSRHVDKGSEGFEWSLFSVWGITISTAIGGAIGGIFAERFGFNNLFLVAGTLYIIATIVIAFLYQYLDGMRKKVMPPFPVE